MPHSILIRTSTDVNEETSYNLQQLGNLIEAELQIRPILKQKKALGEKTIGLTESIEITQLALTAITTFITILQYWKSKKSIFSLKYKVGEIEVDVSNLSEKEFEERILELAKKHPLQTHEVSIKDNE